MKKMKLLFIILLFSLILSACNGSDEPSNSAPILEGITDLEVLKNTEFELLDGITATDDFDGNLTSEITYTVKDKDGYVIPFDPSVFQTYYITYEIIDTSNNKASRQRIIDIVGIDDKAYIEGVEDFTMKVNEEYYPFDHLTVTDEVDGDLIYAVNVTYYFDGERVYNLEYSVPGVYEIVYEVINSRNQVTQKVQTITIEE